MTAKLPHGRHYRLTVKMGRAAQWLGVSRWTLRRLIAKGELKELPYKLIAVADLERLVERWSNAKEAA